MRFLSLVGNSFGCSSSGERLVSAARDGDLQEAKALLEYNPRLVRYSTFGVRNSPLHYSAAQGHYEVVSLLLESGVDINLRNYRGQTALMQACQYGHWEVVQILMLLKANIDSTDYLNGGTALHLAALNGHARCIRLLLADHIPSISNVSNILRKKLKNDESVSAFDWRALAEIVNGTADGGVTALHMAALNGHAETVHLLLDLGASVSATTVDDGTTFDLIGAGSTPLHYAACGGNAQCCQRTFLANKKEASEDSVLHPIYVFLLRALLISPENVDGEPTTHRLRASTPVLFAWRENAQLLQKVVAMSSALIVLYIYARQTARR
ncbi:UNVERIFIED_CONTAM: putative E3 ubiquitin-protein ligase XBOS32 [Sesamum calycinum]|uniref:E3 ubiquitin-protein ligase XBOS32 n=1 Tax=Sesamum calycinum TaxID=2727403 RepID=A0AAW2N2R2_9LAMI